MKMMHKSRVHIHVHVQDLPARVTLNTKAARLLRSVFILVFPLVCFQ